MINAAHEKTGPLPVQGAAKRSNTKVLLNFAFSCTSMCVNCTFSDSLEIHLNIYPHLYLHI